MEREKQRLRLGAGRAHERPRPSQGHEEGPGSKAQTRKVGQKVCCWEKGAFYLRFLKLPQQAGTLASLGYRRGN